MDYFGDLTKLTLILLSIALIIYCSAIKPFKVKWRASKRQLINGTNFVIAVAFILIGSILHPIFFQKDFNENSQAMGYVATSNRGIVDSMKIVDLRGNSFTLKVYFNRSKINKDSFYVWLVGDYLKLSFDPKLEGDKIKTGLINQKGQTRLSFHFERKPSKIKDFYFIHLRDNTDRSLNLKTIRKYYNFYQLTNLPFFPPTDFPINYEGYLNPNYSTSFNGTRPELKKHSVYIGWKNIGNLEKTYIDITTPERENNHETYMIWFTILVSIGASYFVNFLFENVNFWINKKYSNNEKKEVISQCIALTKTGKRCSRKPKKGFDKCPQHLKK